MAVPHEPGARPCYGFLSLSLSLAQSLPPPPPLPNCQSSYEKVLGIRNTQSEACISNIAIEPYGAIYACLPYTHQHTLTHTHTLAHTLKLMCVSSCLHFHVYRRPARCAVIRTSSSPGLGTGTHTHTYCYAHSVAHTHTSCTDLAPH